MLAAVTGKQTARSKIGGNCLFTARMGDRCVLLGGACVGRRRVMVSGR